MSHICFKVSCSNRLSIGSEKNEDSIPNICMDCGRIYNISDTASKSVVKKISVLLALSLLVLLVYNWSSIISKEVPRVNENYSSYQIKLDSLKQKTNDLIKISDPSTSYTIKFYHSTLPTKINALQGNIDAVTDQDILNLERDLEAFENLIPK